MPSEKDMNLARWLIRKGALSKEDAQKALRHQKAQEEIGKKVSLLKICVAAKLLDQGQAEALQEEIKKNQQQIPKLPGPKKKISEVATKKEESDEEDDHSHGTGAESIATIHIQASAPDVEEVASLRRHRCPECQAELESAASECHICSAQLAGRITSTCARCGRPSPVGATSCNYCDADPVSGRAGKATPRCRACTKYILPEDAVCHHCGSYIEALSGSNTKVTTAASGIFILLLCSIGVYAASMLHFGEDRRNADRVERMSYRPFFDELEPEYLEGYQADKVEAGLQKNLLEVSTGKANKGDWAGVETELFIYRKDFNEALLSLYAQSLFEQKKYEQVIALYLEVRQTEHLQRLYAEICLRKAVETVGQEDERRVLSTFEAAMAIRPRDYRLATWASLSALRCKNMNKAEVYSQRALVLGKEHIETWLLRIAVLRAMDEHAAAEENIKALKQEHPELGPWNEGLQQLEAAGP